MSGDRPSGLTLSVRRAGGLIQTALCDGSSGLGARPGRRRGADSFQSDTRRWTPKPPSADIDRRKFSRLTASA